MSLQIHQPGSIVNLNSNIEAVILAATIHAAGRIQYHVAWWDLRTRNTQWVEAHEVSPSARTSRPLPIGFLPQS